jgi:hypothetical protein
MWDWKLRRWPLRLLSSGTWRRVCSDVSEEPASPIIPRPDHTVPNPKTALVRIPYVSLCVTYVDLVCPHCEDVPNVDSHSGVRIHVAVLVAGYLWPLAAEWTTLQILFCFVSASKGWWAFLVSGVWQRHSFENCWQIYQVSSFVVENI